MQPIERDRPRPLVLQGVAGRGAQRLVAAATCAAVFSVAGELFTAAMTSSQWGGPVWLGPTEMLDIALPALVGGLLFFPVGGMALATRGRFAGRSARAAAVGALVHRVLLFTPFPISTGPKASWVSGLLAVLGPRATSVRWLGLDSTWLAELLAVAFAGALAALVHPALLREWRRGGSKARPAQ